MRLYQANHGLPQTGVVDAATAQAMGLFTPSGPVGAIQPGGPAPARSYTVVRGDSLYGIARKTGISIGDLLALNNLNLRSVIHPGMVLNVVAGSGAAATGPVGWTDVAIGSRGAAVAAAQRAIINSGIFLRGGADGVFGPYTQAALRQYQANRGLPQTGVVDTATAVAMGLYTAPAPATAYTPAAAATPTAAPETAPTTTAPAAAPAEVAVGAEALSTETMTADVAMAAAEPVDSEPIDSGPADGEGADGEPATTAEPVAESVIGDLVWIDEDGDGEQDSEDVGLPNVTVRLLGSDGEELAATITDWQGEFLFAGLPAATYDVEVALPEGHTATTANAGLDETIDSDANADPPVEDQDPTATVSDLTLDGSEKNLDVDIGLVATAVSATTAAEVADAEPATTGRLPLPPLLPSPPRARPSRRRFPPARRKLKSSPRTRAHPAAALDNEQRRRGRLTTGLTVGRQLLNVSELQSKPDPARGAAGRRSGCRCRASTQPDVGRLLPLASNVCRCRKIAAASGGSPGASPERLGPMLASMSAAREYDCWKLIKYSFGLWQFAAVAETRAL